MISPVAGGASGQEDSQSYLMEGHVPGAILTEKEDWRVMDEATGALVRKSVEEYERMFRSWGIDNDSQVVLYYKGNRMNEILGAVYAYWIFHLLGHRKVGILDGGWQAWLKGRYPVSYEEPQVSEGSFRASYDPRKEIDARYLLENVGRKPIIDGRPVEHYFGISKFPAAKKYGHVPCSVPLPWEWWIRKDEETGKLYLEFPRYVAEFLRNQGISEDEEVRNEGLRCFQEGVGSPRSSPEQIPLGNLRGLQGSLRGQLNRRGLLSDTSPPRPERPLL